MASPLKSYRDLLVWQKGIDLVVVTYRATAAFPKSETYGLTSQIRRAATSIPANIAEGYGRGSRKEYVQFLMVAQGSLKELETHFIVSEKLSYLTAAQTERLLSQTEELGRMLGALIRKLKSASTSIPTPNTPTPAP
ncbi:MAG TPA: four helix bundle protein [Pyrinomonadaceae bacterium]|jgi:four helix bundle protein|nr:four helix bundle protein [Pyrinomonadaceae bacterium]